MGKFIQALQIINIKLYSILRSDSKDNKHKSLKDISIYPG